MLDTQQEVAEFTRAIVAKVAAQMTLPELRPATVVTVDDIGAVTVHVDGDEASAIVRAESLVPALLVVDQRVMVTFQPPRACFVTGVIQSPLTFPWVDYTPAWTAASGTPPSLGNGSLVGAYQDLGATFHVRIHLEMGSTTTYGTSGAFRLSLPPGFVLATDFALFEHQVGSAVCQDSTGTTVAAVCRQGPIDGILNIFSAAGVVTLGSPFTWASTDLLSVQGTFEKVP